MGVPTWRGHPCHFTTKKQGSSQGDKYAIPGKATNARMEEVFTHVFMTFSGSAPSFIEAYYTPNQSWLARTTVYIFWCLLYIHPQTKGPSLKIEMLLGLFSIFFNAFALLSYRFHLYVHFISPDSRNPLAVPNRSDVFSSFLRIFRGKIQQLSTCGPLTSFRCLVLGGF